MYIKDCMEMKWGDDIKSPIFECDDYDDDNDDDNDDVDVCNDDVNVVDDYFFTQYVLHGDDADFVTSYFSDVTSVRLFQTLYDVVEGYIRQIEV